MANSSKNNKKVKNIDSNNKVTKTNQKSNNKIKKENVKNKNEENLSLTRQQRFDFDKNDIVIEDNNSKKNSSRRKDNKVIIIEKKVYPKVLILMLLLIIILFSIFTYCHFTSFDHNKVEKKYIYKENDENIVFLGDSITWAYDVEKHFENMHVVNSGISGDFTLSILNDMNNRIYKYNPTKVFILIGTNDINIKKSEDEIVKNIETIIKNIQANRPSAKIYLQSIYPINNSEHEKIIHENVGIRTNEKIKAINKKLANVSKEYNVKYINLYDKLIDKDGNLIIDYTKEGLHINEEGYKYITSILKKYL